MPHTPILLDRIERIANVGHWRVDLEKNEVLWSNGVYEMHGLTPEVYTPDLETGIDAYVPEDREMVRACVEEAINNAKPFKFNCRLQHASGTIRHVISIGEVEKNDKGKVIAIFGVIKDITPIIEQKERFELAALGSNSAMWDWDIANDRIYWDGRSFDILEVSGNEALPQSSTEFFKNLVHPEDHDKLKEGFANYFKNKDGFDIELRVKKGSGEYIWTLARAQAKWNDQDQAIRISGSLTDINELKTMEQKLRRSNEDLNQFASIAAHDLQQPLRAIAGFLDILREKHAENLNDDARKYIDLSIDGAENMSELISDLLEYSRLETDGIQHESVNTHHLVERTLLSLQGAIEDYGADAKIEGTLPTIQGDALKLQRLFYNLIENGMKYNKSEKPSVTIQAETLENGDHEFSIRDNGIGIEERNFEKVFLMFNRLHTKTKYNGTGIGLAICKKVVDLHNGQIWVESKHGEGTTFKFVIPANNG